MISTLRVDDCNILQDFKNVSLNDTTTASNTVVLFGDLEDASVAMKIFPDFHKIPELGKYKYNYEGLKYEKRVYSTIVPEMLKKCDNFIGYVGYVECTLSSFPKHIQRLIQSKKLKSKKRLTYGDIINENTILHCLITEVISSEHLISTYALGDVYDQLSKSDRELVMIQIFWALEVMSEFNLAHNDLHAMNIILAEYDEPVSIKIRNSFIETYYVPYLYDWDYSYSSSLGENKRISKFYSCSDINICNKYYSKTDIYILLCFLRNLYPKLKDDILDYYGLNTLFRYQNTNKKTLISKKSVSALLPYYSGKNRNDESEMYKIDVNELKSILTKGEYKNFTKGVNIIGSVMFGIDEIGESFYIVHKNGFHCRASAFDENMPTPADILTELGF